MGNNPSGFPVAPPQNTSGRTHRRIVFPPAQNNSSAETSIIVTPPEKPAVERNKEGNPNTPSMIDLAGEASQVFGLGEKPLSLAKKNSDGGQRRSSPRPPKSYRTRASTLGGAAGKASKTDKKAARPESIPTMFMWSLSGHSVIKTASLDTQQSTLQSSSKPKEVLLSGSFNGWQPIRMNASHSNFVMILDLPEGSHEYKFRVDGVWQHNPKEATTSDGMGGYNNVIKVTESDFEVFEALENDTADQRSKAVPVQTFCDDFGRECPDLSTPSIMPSKGPPILPPQLLHVILNKDTPLACEPTLLPTPNHVMVNHMYALSIKDRVMVMSATQRFRKKYVTTILYRPI